MNDLPEHLTDWLVEKQQAEAERDALAAQLATLAEAAQALREAEIDLARDAGEPEERAALFMRIDAAESNLDAALANLPAAAQEWEQRIRDEVEAEWRSAMDALDDERLRQLANPNLLDLASPDAEQRLAAAIGFRDGVTVCTIAEGDMPAIAERLRDAASQPAEPVEWYGNDGQDSADEDPT